ncbi:heterokaryon incompatibility protein-domain-containing protein [Phascolomyces articulosus]|uniref:Heterokaryon incompatibility protein-domain-containing protein n=1 Tax=Phascolomyces articulosus TaxID=60185 RepID=A0AAD5KVC7_9FUNG|nr:heterokaryon incompatibility protein-domain-containing protein [Phascolomyces articulosus]
MYITYEIAQWSENHSKVVKDSNNKSIPQIVKQDEPFEIIPDGLPKPVYTPTKLVRISDMKVVDSSQVHEGYCALSYSWSWSGDYALDKVRNKYVRIDDGKHKIISIDKEAQHTEEEKEKEIPCTKVKYVQFKDVIQQICQQFNIKYLWFDQMCINQHHKEEKYREIKKMHTIYDNAHCTLVLVPEFRVDVMMNDHFFEKEQFYHLLPDYPYDIHDEDSPDKHYNAAALGLFKAQENIGRSDWYNRLWTLEEAIKSNILLFVGQNTHVFGHHLIPGHKIAYLTMPSDQNVPFYEDYSGLQLLKSRFQLILRVCSVKWPRFLRKNLPFSAALIKGLKLTHLTEQQHEESITSSKI